MFVTSYCKNTALRRNVVSICFIYAKLGSTASPVKALKNHSLALFLLSLRKIHAQIDSGGVAAVFALSALFSRSVGSKGDPHVLLTTSARINIELELNSQKAPVSVKTFVDYVNSGFYNNTTFSPRYSPGFHDSGRWF